MPANPGIDDAQLREIAAEVLARPEYAAFRGPPNALQQLVERVADWLRGLSLGVPEWLDRWLDAVKEALFSFLSFAVAADSAAATILRLVVAVAILAAVGLILERVTRSLRERLADRDAAPRAGPERGGRDLVTEADWLAADGRYLEAAHCLQLSALQLLLRGDWVELDRSEPNRTLRRRLAAAPLPDALRAEFLKLLDRLEGRWFRDRAEDRPLYDAWCGLHARLAALAASRR